MRDGFYTLSYVLIKWVKIKSSVKFYKLNIIPHLCIRKMCIINSLDLGIGIENWRLAESKSECDISIPYSRESMSRLSPLQITHSQNLNFIQWHRQCIAIVTWGRKSPQVQVSRSSEYGDDSVGGADR